MPIVQVALALTQFAPQLMRFFGAGEPSVAVAEKVIGLAQGITGAPTPEAALEAIRANADFQRAFAMRSLEIDADLERAYLADRADARAHDVEVRKLSGGANHRADIMVLLDVLGLIACLVVLCLFRKEMPSEVIGLLTTIATAFALCLRDAHQFEFGSSRGSKDKDSANVEIMQRLAAMPAPIVDRGVGAKP